MDIATQRPSLAEVNAYAAEKGWPPVGAGLLRKIYDIRIDAGAGLFDEVNTARNPGISYIDRVPQGSSTHSPSSAGLARAADFTPSLDLYAYQSFRLAQSKPGIYHAFRQLAAKQGEC